MSCYHPAPQVRRQAPLQSCQASLASACLEELNSALHRAQGARCLFAGQNKAHTVFDKRSNQQPVASTPYSYC